MSSDPIDLYYESWGEGEPLLAAGGWGMRAAEDFAKLFPRISAGRQVITFHYRGMGQSPDGSLERPTTRDYAADALRVLERGGWERVQLVGGGGMGPLVLSELAIMAPQRAGAIVMHEPWAVADTSLRWQLQALRAARLESFEAYQQLATILCFTPEYIETHASHIREHLWVNLRDRLQTHLRFIDCCIDHDGRERLPLLRAPALLITGDETDIMTGHRLLPALQRLVPHAESHVMRGAPHAFFQNPGAVVEFDTVAAGFLARHPLSSGRAAA